MRRQMFGMCLIAGLLMSVASAPLIGQGAMKEKSLYDRLGKKKDHGRGGRVCLACGRRRPDQRALRATAGDPARPEEFLATWSIRFAKRARRPGLRVDGA